MQMFECVIEFPFYVQTGPPAALHTLAEAWSTVHFNQFSFLFETDLELQTDVVSETFWELGL